jgi:hypothetical protein
MCYTHAASPFPIHEQVQRYKAAVVNNLINVANIFDSDVDRQALRHMSAEHSD